MNSVVRVFIEAGRDLAVAHAAGILHRDFKPANFEDQGACSNGRHEMHSANPFGVTVWGWGTDVTSPYQSLAVSYAYPAGASFRAINDVVVPPG